MIYYYLPPAAEGHVWEIIKCLPYMRESVRPSVRHVFAQTLISHSFIKISSPNMQGMVKAMKTYLQNFSLILKNKMAAIANCLKIIKVL